MGDQAQAELLGQLCRDLRLMWMQAGGPPLQTLGKAVRLSKSQVGAILNGDIRRLPDWDVVKGLVQCFRQHAHLHGRTENVSIRAGIEEFWRPRYEVVQHSLVLKQTRRTSAAKIRAEDARQTMAADRDASAPGKKTSTTTGALQRPREPREDLPHVPSLLPPAIADFTGRAQEVDRICALLIEAGSADSSSAVAMVVIAGRGGIGKTALAVCAAHLLRGDFPDGQLYADLRGMDDPAAPVDVLARFLNALGVDAVSIPKGAIARAEMFRDQLAGRRMLVLLDNARDESQVEALLPGTRSCAVVVTSRRRLTALAGATILELDVLSSDAALQLLAMIAGSQRVAAERDAAVELVDLCGRLPLAVRVAGARLAAKSHWRLAYLVARLADEGRRLDELTYRHMEVRASFALSYQGVDAQAQRLLRMMGLVDAPDMAAWVAARLLDIPVTDAEEILEQLVDGRLVDVTDSDPTRQASYIVYLEPTKPARYRLHDLIRLYARERAWTEDAVEDRTAALRRVLGTWLDLIQHAADSADVYARPRGDTSRWPLDPWLVERLLTFPLAWFDHERPNIISMIRQAASDGYMESCWELALTTSGLFSIRNDPDNSIACLEHGLACARQIGNIRAQTMLLIEIGMHLSHRQHCEQAAVSLQEARRLAEQVRELRALGLALLGLAHIHRFQACYPTALLTYQQAHEALQTVADPIDVDTTRGIGQVLLLLGNLDEAQDYLESALQTARRFGNSRLIGTALYCWGELRLCQGRVNDAEAAFDEVLQYSSKLTGELIHQARALFGLGSLAIVRGSHDHAAMLLHEAASIAYQIGNRIVEARALTTLAELHHIQRDSDQATVHITRAISICRSIRTPHLLAKAVQVHSDIIRRAGDNTAAQASANEARDIYKRIGIPLET